MAVSEALVRESMAGNRDALAHIIEEVRHDLWGFLMGRLGDFRDAEDVYQDVWMKVTRQISQLRDPTSFRSWLFAIAMNAVRNHVRRPKLITQLSDDEDHLDPEPSSDEPSAQQQLLDRERLDIIVRGLSGLKERQREALLLEAFGDIPQKQIANLVGENLNTVKTQIRRARIKLARLLAEVGVD